MPDKPTYEELEQRLRDLETRFLERDSFKQEMYHTIFENAGSGIVVLEEDTTILMANTCFEKLTGYTLREIEGKVSWTVFISPEDLGRMKQYHVMRRKDPSLVPNCYEFDLLDKSGETKKMLLNIAMIPGTGRSVAACMDITELKKAQDALRRSEERYRDILDNIEEAYYEVDLNGNFTFFNNTPGKNLGYTSEELMGMNYREYMGKSDAERVCKEFHRVFVTGKPGISGWEIVKRGVSGRYAEVSISLMKDDEGKPIGFSGIVRDITERKKVEETLRQSQERLDLALKGAELGLWDCHISTGRIFFNERSSEMLGYAAKRITTGLDLWEKRVHPDDIAHVKDSIKKHIKGRTPYVEMEYRVINKKGKWIWILERGKVVERDKDGMAVRMAGTYLDITQRRKAENALRESQERFKNIAELLPEAIYESDLDGNLTFVNQSALELFGYTFEEFESGVNIIDIIAPEDCQRVRDKLSSMSKNEATGLMEYSACKKDGTVLPVLTHSNMIVREGVAVGIRGVIIDISEKKRLENQLVRAQKMEAIGTLAGGIAHDFNNLLMGIQGNASLMLLNLDKTAPEYKRLKGIEQYVQRGADLTRQLLGVARGGKYDVLSVDLRDIMLKSSEMFGRTKKEIHIHRTYNEDLWAVEVDKGQMEQVFLNLYVNAGHAMPEGGELYLEADNVILDENDVEPHELSAGRYVKIVVADTGIGMDETTKSRIFDPFFTTKDRGVGTGLGLASVYGIIKNHNGFITVDSRAGEGATFTIYLPASDKVVEKDKMSPDIVLHGTETVLLVDDEKLILDIGGQMLRSLGYTVFTAGDGKEAIEIYARKKSEIDIIILDIIMPGMGGSEIFDRLIEIDPDACVLLSSGYSIEGQALDIIKKGSRGFIQKPFDLRGLSIKMRDILDDRLK